MGLLKDCEELFHTNDLYKLLNITNEANNSIIKKAYRKLSLKVHPDRVQSKDKKVATLKFQVLSKVCSVLLDEDLRKIYDEDGEIDDGKCSFDKDIKDWTQYWKTLFNMNIEDMKKFEDTYRGSQTEIDDLKQVYIECEGDMDLIFENQICSYIEDENRFRKILQEAIDKKEIPDFDKFSKESKTKRKKRLRHYNKEAKLAEKERKKRGLDECETEEDLTQLILKRQGNRKKEMDSFLSNLEAKYANPSKKKKISTRSKKKS